MKREIHIWDLPINKIYINLKEGFREEFFDKAKDIFGSWSKLGDSLKIKRGDTLIACDWKRGRNCFPLEIGFKICDLINLPKEELEGNISMIRAKTFLKKRGGYSGKPVINPKLPIKINEDFVEILGHICGDGTIVTKNICKGIKLGYINSNPKLIENFRELMKNVFGDIEPYIAVRYERLYPRYTKPNYYLQYPTITSLFVLFIFDYKTKDNMDLPNFIDELTKREICVFLRALFDDEGSVSPNKKRVELVLKPKKPIESICKLLRSLDIHPTLYYYKDRTYVLQIAQQNSVIRFSELINFKHPEKNKKLKCVIENGWRFRRYGDYVAHAKIINFLKKYGHLSIKDLSSCLNRCPSTIKDHMKNLKNKGVVDYTIIKQNSYPYTYRKWHLVGDNFE